MKKVVGLLGIVIAFVVCFVIFNVLESKPTDSNEISDIEFNENNAVASLLVIASNDVITKKGGKSTLKPEIKNATTPESAYNGYYFTEGYSTALPAKYPDTGKNTIIITNTGVFKKDTGGKDPGDLDNLDGWVSATQ